jgi:hypothetical protein
MSRSQSDVSVGASRDLSAPGALREQLAGGLTATRRKSPRACRDRSSRAERGALRAHFARVQKDCAVSSAGSSPERRVQDLGASRPRFACIILVRRPEVAVGGRNRHQGATVLAAGLVVTSVGHEPVKARATAERGAAKQAAAQRTSPATSRGAQDRSLSRRANARRTARKAASKRFGAAVHAHARNFGNHETDPGPAPARAAALAGFGLGDDPAAAARPSPVQQTPYGSDSAPPLPLPIQLPAGPIQLPAASPPPPRLPQRPPQEAASAHPSVVTHGPPSRRESARLARPDGLRRPIYRPCAHVHRAACRCP